MDVEPLSPSRPAQPSVETDEGHVDREALGEAQARGELHRVGSVQGVPVEELSRQLGYGGGVQTHPASKIGDLVPHRWKEVFGPGAQAEA